MHISEKINILLSLSMSRSIFLFYDFNLNTKGFVYIEFVNYQQDLHGNVRVFAKCNVCIAAIQVFTL